MLLCIVINPEKNNDKAKHILNYVLKIVCILMKIFFVTEICSDVCN